MDESFLEELDQFIHRDTLSHGDLANEDLSKGEAAAVMFWAHFYMAMHLLEDTQKYSGEPLRPAAIKRVLQICQRVIEGFQDDDDFRLVIYSEDQLEEERLQGEARPLHANPSPQWAATMIGDAIRAVEDGEYGSALDQLFLIDDPDQDQQPMDERPYYSRPEAERRSLMERVKGLGALFEEWKRRIGKGLGQEDSDDRTFHIEDHSGPRPPQPPPDDKIQYN